MVKATASKSKKGAKTDAQKMRFFEQFVANVVNAVAAPTASRQSQPTDWHTQLTLAREIRETDASSIIDFMLGAANTGIEITVGEDYELLMQEFASAGQPKKKGAPPKTSVMDKKRKLFKSVCDYWAANVNFELVDEEPGLDRLNETFYEEMWGGGSLWVSQYALVPTKIPELGASFKLPMRIMQHNPDLLQVNFGTKFLERTIEIGSPTSAITLKNSRDGISKWQTMDGKQTKEDLPAQGLIVSSWTKKQYNRMPTPYLMRASEPYTLRKQLMATDSDIAKNILAALLVFKEGIPNMDPPQREELQKLSTDIKSMIDSIGEKQLRWFLSGPNFDAKWVVPPTESLLSSAKYYQANMDFLSRLGIIVEPKLAASSDGGFKLISISPLIAIIETGRRKCKRMNERYLKVIRDSNKEFADLEIPNVRQKRMHMLEDPQKIKMAVQNLFDRGLGWKFICDEFGLDLGEALRQGIFERQNNVEDVLKPRATFRQQADGRPAKGEQPKPDSGEPQDDDGAAEE